MYVTYTKSNYSSKYYAPNAQRYPSLFSVKRG
jgi:hypothetical protein